MSGGTEHYRGHLMLRIEPGSGRRDLVHHFDQRTELVTNEESGEVSTHKASACTPHITTDNNLLGKLEHWLNPSFAL